MIDRIARHRRDQENGEAGFTLIELLVVVVIIGILTAIAVPLYLNYRKGANDKAAQSDLRSAVATLEQCMSDNAKYPTAVGGAVGVGTITGCTGQTTTAVSDGTVITYAPASTTDLSNYRIFSKSDNGTKTYCFASAAGGSVKAGGAAAAAYAATCPAA